MWERNVLTRISGPVNDRGMWRIRPNIELADLYEDIDLATVIKTLWLRRLGHVCRMEGQRDPKKALEGKTWEKKEEREPTYKMY
jgi:hypothetical protein